MANTLAMSGYVDMQSSVVKKMAAVHFTTMPCEPYTAHTEQGKPYFCNICTCANDIVYVRFEDFRTFLYVVMTVLKFSWAKNYGQIYESPSFLLRRICQLFQGSPPYLNVFFSSPSLRKSWSS